MARVGSRSRGAPQEPRPHPTPPPILYYNSPNGVSNTNVPTLYFLQCGNVVLGLVLGTSKLPRPTPMFPQYSFCSVGTWCWGWGWVPTPNTNVPTMQFLQCGNVVLGVGLASHAQRHCSHNAVSVVWGRGVGGGFGLPRLTPMLPQGSFCCVGTWCLGWGRAPTPNTNVPTMQFLHCGSAVLGRL